MSGIKLESIGTLYPEASAAICKALGLPEPCSFDEFKRRLTLAGEQVITAPTTTNPGIIFTWNGAMLAWPALPVTIPLAKDPILHAVKVWLTLAAMWKTATFDHERTPVDRAARQQWARIARRPSSDFEVVTHKPRVGDCYDFLCPWTRQYGQCWLKKDGSGEWHQAPEGKAPVLFVLKNEQRDPNRPPLRDTSGRFISPAAIGARR